MLYGSGARVRSVLCSSGTKGFCKSCDDAFVVLVLIASRGSIGAWIKNIGVDECYPKPPKATSTSDHIP